MQTTRDGRAEQSGRVLVVSRRVGHPPQTDWVAGAMLVAVEVGPRSSQRTNFPLPQATRAPRRVAHGAGMRSGRVWGWRLWVEAPPMDAISLLKDDHKTVERLFKR